VSQTTQATASIYSSEAQCASTTQSSTYRLPRFLKGCSKTALLFKETHHRCRIDKELKEAAHS